MGIFGSPATEIDHFGLVAGPSDNNARLSIRRPVHGARNHVARRTGPGAARERLHAPGKHGDVDSIVAVSRGTAQESRIGH